MPTAAIVVPAQGRTSNLAIISALLGGGVAILTAIYFAQRRVIVNKVEEAAQTGSDGGKVDLRLTGYWPKAAKTAAEKLMEGGADGAAAWNGKRVVDPTTGKRVQLHTLEEFLAGKASFVAASGDPSVWPFGQRLVVPELGATVIIRVVDTGGHFMGAHKVVRILGREPIDICVDGPSTKVPTKATAFVVPGDSWEADRTVAYNKAGKTNVSGIVDAFTSEDHEALSRMLASELGTSTLGEQVAAAWAVRNRAADSGHSIGDLLAPTGEYGPQDSVRPYASTRFPGTNATDEVADRVLAMAEDPTGGAIDFWRPGEQDARKRMSDTYHLAVVAGDGALAARLVQYRGYTKTANEVRNGYRRGGLVVCGAIGSLELLRRV